MINLNRKMILLLLVVVVVPVRIIPLIALDRRQKIFIQLMKIKRLPINTQMLIPIH